MFNDDCMDHLSETGDKPKIANKDISERRIRSYKFHLLLWRVITYRLVDTSFNWLAGLFSGERLNRVLALQETVAN